MTQTASVSIPFIIRNATPSGSPSDCVNPCSEARPPACTSSSIRCKATRCQPAAAFVSLTLAPETFAITTLGIDVTADPVHKTYGESDPALTYSVTPSPLSGDSFSGNLARAPGEDAGVYAITQGSLTAGGNYAITFHAADFTIHQAAQAPLVISLSPDSLQVGGTGTLSASGGSGTGAVSFEVTDGAAVCQVVGDTLTAIGVGTCTVTVTKAGDVNHLVASATLVVAVGAAAAAPTLIPASGWLALLAMCLLMLAGAWLGVQRVRG